MALLSLLALLEGCSTNTSDNVPASTDYSQVAEQMRAYINDQMPVNMVTGAAIALVDDGRLVWSEGFGYADREAGVPAGADTIFEIGSVSKTLTTMALMRLVDEGKLDIDQPVETYIPEFTINQRFTSLPITVRSMLTHHSGLPTDIFIGGFTVDSPDLTWVDWLIAYLKDEYTANPVGYSGAYSNTAFAMLHKVIENASGQPFYTFTDQMFDFLGMGDTTYGSRTLPAARISKAYYNGELQPFVYTNLSTSGSIRSTVVDMSKFMANVLLAGGGAWLKSATMNEVFSDQSTGSLADSTTKQGICFFLNEGLLDYAGRIAWHNGATVDMTSQMTVLLDHGLGAIMITNSATGGLLAHDAVVKTLQLALESKKGVKPSAPADLPDSPSATPPAGLIASITGYYVGEGSPYLITDNGSGGINVEVEGRTTAMGYMQNGRWKASGSKNQFEFRKVGQDRILFYWTSVGNNFRMGKLFRPAAISAAWQARAGDWEIVNLPANDAASYVNPDIALVKKTITLRIENGVLLIDGPLRTNMVLDPQSDTLAFTAGIGRNRGESLRMETVDGEETLLISGARYVKS